MLAFAAALLGTTACSEREVLAPTTGNTVVVHAILDPSSRDQTVGVQIARGTAKTLEVVTGATVRMILPDGRQLQAIPDPPARGILFGYHFPLDKLGFELVPGGTYQLQVYVPDGRVVTGHTTIPNVAPVSLAPPEERFRPNVDTLRMHWDRVAAARGYEVSVLRIQPTFVSPFAFFTDTSLELTPASKTMTGNALFTLSSFHQLAVSAVDSNYYDYYRRESDIFTGVGLISHLEGGEGLFGSFVPIAARLLNVY